MKEEDDILRRVGTDNAFKVPEGYFKNFKSELMAKLPEKLDVSEKKLTTTIWKRVKPWTYLAAMFIGAVLIVHVISFMGNEKTKDVHSSATEIAQDKYIDEAIDNSHLENYQLYEYLTDADTK